MFSVLYFAEGEREMPINVREYFVVNGTFNTMDG
jgi:hypothetical protein